MWGSLLADQTDAVEGSSIAVTPDGIGKLAAYAKQKELEKFNLISSEEKIVQPTDCNLGDVTNREAPTSSISIGEVVGGAIGAAAGGRYGQKIRNNGGSRFAPLFYSIIGAITGGKLGSTVENVVHDLNPPRCIP